MENKNQSDVATMLEILRTELLRDGKDSMFFIANTDQELLLVKKRINGKLVWALPEETDFQAFGKKIANYIQKQK